MDKMDMMSLELPDTEGLANADEVSGAVVQENTEDNSSYEYDGADIPEEDIPVPVLSEMDGSEVSSGAVSPERRGEGSGGSAGQGLPELSEMSDMPYSRSVSGAGGAAAGNPGGMASGVSGGYNRANPGGQSTYSPVGGNSGGSASSYGGSGNGGSQGYNGSSGYSQNQGRTDFYDMMNEETMLAAKGEKTARIIGNITLVISILDGLVGLLGFNIRVIITAVYHIYFCIQFKKGSHNSRYWLGAGCVLTVISSIISVLEVASLTEMVVQLTGSSAIITVAQIICLIPVFLFAVLAYFFLLDKSVAAYCERYSGRVD